jgi:hypothetical protein
MISLDKEDKMAKRTHLDLAEYHFKKLGIPDDVILEAFRLILISLVERCDDPAILQQIYCDLGGRGLPYDEKFAQAVRKVEAQDALKKALQVIDGGKKVT